MAEAAINPVPHSADEWREAAADEADSLVKLDLARYDRTDGDPLAWTDHVAMLERDWFEPCLRLLQTGQLKTLYLYGDDGYRYSLTGAARWRFWRHRRTL